MKKSIDGDCMCFTKDDFINIQESPAVFIPLVDENVQAIIRDGSIYAASGEFLVGVHRRLAAQPRNAGDVAPIGEFDEHSGSSAQRA